MAQQINLLKVEAIGPLREELQDAVDDAQEARDDAQEAQGHAETAQLAAETARDGAFTNADVYATTGDGIAATSNGDQFQVVEGDELVRYLNDNGNAVEVARYPAATALTKLASDHGHLSALLGQTAREAGRLRDAQGVTPPVPAAVGALAAIVSQLARQVDGGRIRLAGGSLDDPAIQIGTASIYSAAADTLSIAVGDVERLRITTSGITVYGTVTEV